MKTEIDLYLIIFLSAVLIAAAINDLRFQKIPNLLTYPSMVTAVGCHVVMNGLNGLLFTAGGLALGIAVFILPYPMGGMGAGDTKLMGSVGAILGAKGVFVAFLFTAIAGGIYALILLLVWRRAFKGFFTGDNNEKKPKLCYGIAIALGTLFSVFLEFSGFYKFPI